MLVGTGDNGGSWSRSAEGVRQKSEPTDCAADQGERDGHRQGNERAGK